VDRPGTDRPRPPALASRATLRRAARSLAQDPELKGLLKPYFLRLAPPVRGWLKERLASEAEPRPPAGPAPGGAYLDPFFAQDRLVSTERLRTEYPDFHLSTLEENRELLERYYRFRFTDLVPGEGGSPDRGQPNNG
jgi:hypothetical protein